MTWSSWASGVRLLYNGSDARDRKPSIDARSHPILARLPVDTVLTFEVYPHLHGPLNVLQATARKSDHGYFFLRRTRLPDGWPDLPNEVAYRVRWTGRSWSNELPLTPSTAGAEPVTIPSNDPSRVEVGETYRLNHVIENLGNDYYLVRCEGCGLERRVWRYNVRRGIGCRRCSQRVSHLDVPPVRDPATGKALKEYVAWGNMIVRVTMPSTWSRERYEESYGNLEIEPEWLGPDGFPVFYRDVGPAPSPGHLLDRRDNERGYLRENVRWVTPHESNVNGSNTRWLTVHGLTKTLQEWADDLGITSTGLANRLDVLGWSVEEAVTLPTEVNRPSNDLYYLQIAGRVAKRGTCLRRHVGCVLVDRHYRVISTSYNSVPTGVPNCTVSPCPGAYSSSGTDLHLCVSKHAEELALIKCADVYQIFTCYVTTSPCEGCVRRLMDTSCERIVFAEPYPHPGAADLWRGRGGEWVQVTSEKES